MKFCEADPCRGFFGVETNKLWARPACSVNRLPVKCHPIKISVALISSGHSLTHWDDAYSSRVGPADLIVLQIVLGLKIGEFSTCWNY